MAGLTVLDKTLPPVALHVLAVAEAAALVAQGVMARHSALRAPPGHHWQP